MQLILAIDSDPRRSEQLAALVRARLGQVDLVQATSAGEGLHALRDRVPDLILTSPLLSPFDDGVLDEYLRELGAAAAHVQTLRIPVLSSGPRKKSAATRLFSLGRRKTQTSPAAPDGCDPKVFADEIAHYLTRSLEARTVARATQNTSAATGEASAPPAAADADTGFPGSIFDLREATPAPPVDDDLPIVIAKEPRAPAEPEPAIQPDRTTMFLEPEPVEPAPVSYILPEPVAIEPAPVAPAEPVSVIRPATFVQPEPAALVEPEPVESVRARPVEFPKSEPVVFVGPEPAATVRPEPVERKTPEPIKVTPRPAPPASIATRPAPASESGRSPSFEAALAAIRAAWGKTDDRKPAAKPTTTAAPAKTPASSEVDLTAALEQAAVLDRPGPAHESLRASSVAATGQGRVEKPARPEKPQALEAQPGGSLSDWLDPDRYELSTLVRTLDEVTDREEAPTGAANSR